MKEVALLEHKLKTFKNRLKMSDFKTPVGTIGCGLETVGETLKTLDEKYGTEEGKIVVPGAEALAVLGMSYITIKDVVKCTGKELVIEFGDSAGANAAEAILKFIVDFIEGQVKPEVVNDNV